MRYNKNTYYAIYDNNDNYMGGFDTIEDLASACGYSSATALSRSISNYKEKVSYIETIEDKKECQSELLLIIQRTTHLPKGSKIFRFIEV